MKKVVGVFTVVLVLAVASVSEARSVQPLDPNLVGVISYEGTGFRSEYLEFAPRVGTHLRLRMPNHCAIAINSIRLRGERGRAHGNLVTAYNDGLYSHWIYSIENGRGAEVDEIELGLSSAFFYTAQHACGVRVWVTSETVVSPLQ